MGGVNKFKVGDVVKCVEGVYNNLTVGKEYVLVEVSNDCGVKVENDMGEVVYYYSYRFELINSDETSQPQKFKEGDMVYLIGFNHFKPCKLLTTGGNYLTMKFKVKVDGGNYLTFTENGCYAANGVEPSIVLATEENRKMLNKLLGVEYEPLKLTGSDLAKKLLKDKPQTCYVSDNSDENATSNELIYLVVKFENGVFITMSGIHWVHAVPCNQHGRILEDE